MRQAGRYHDHYQSLKRNHTFEELCKKPRLAAETAMGPINEFDFDVAILFSDILFPLEALGMDLSYNPGPQFGLHLDEDNAEITEEISVGPRRGAHFCEEIVSVLGLFFWRFAQ